MRSLLCLMITVLTTASAFSQPGTLDISFGDKGFVSDNNTSLSVHAAVVQQPDGKLLTAGGYLDADFNRKGNIMRFLSDGTIDSTFGNNGYASIGDLAAGAYDIALQPEGKIVIVGSLTLQDGGHSFVARFQTNGFLDSSFGENGLTLIPNTHINDAYLRLALEPDGKIIIAGPGVTDDRQTFYSIISRMSANGAFDNSFGDKGRVLNYTNLAEIYETGLAIQKDGKILLAGHTLGVGDDGEDYVLSRYNPDGTLDDGFGNHSNVITQGVQGLNGHDAPGGITVQPDGKIVVGGTTSGYNFIIYAAALRYNANGTLDETFGNEGRTLVAFDGKRAQTYAVLLQPDGKIILSGSAGNTTERDFTLCRLNSDGTPDSSFATDGKQLTAFDQYATAYCATLQTDGKIVQGGSYENDERGYESHLLARYNNDISRRQIIVTRIKRWLQHHGITWQGDNNVRYYTVQRSMDGGITYQPLARLYNSRQSALSYEEAIVANNALYRVAATAKDGSRSVSNSLLLSNDASVKLFPNPVRSTLQVQGLPTDNKTNITVTDFSGNVRTSTTASGGTVSINVSTLKPGNYLLKVQSGGSTTTQTFVKE